MSIPQQSQALIIESKGVLKLKQVDTPKPAKGEILVKVEAVALNPTDWKHRDNVSPPGAGLGCDFSGKVAALGEGVTNVKEGERVAGFIHGGKDQGHGSFAEYLVTGSTLVWKVPDSTTPEEAAALGGIGPHTAFQALQLRLGLPWPSKPISSSEPFLVWGGSSSVGLYAIQLAHLAGYKVIATSSPKNFDLLKKFGASAVYDYADESTPKKIAEEHPDIKLALDTIAEKGTTLKVTESIKSGKGHVATLLPTRQQTEGDADLKVEAVLVYTTLGRAFDFPGWAKFEANPADKKALEEWSEYVPSLIESGKYKSNPLWHQEGGLEKINEGLELLKAGKNSAQKLTYKIGA